MVNYLLIIINLFYDNLKIKFHLTGLALNESPVSMAVYILEKFSTWTNPDYRFKEDGGLLEKYTMDELLDNVMIYWVTNSMTTSMRLYAETFNTNNWGKHDKLVLFFFNKC